MRRVARFVRRTLLRVADAPIATAIDINDRYASWLASRLHERAALMAEAAPDGLLSLLTCVYGGSPASLFQETAQSVLGQGEPRFEWVVLAQGALSADLASAVNEVNQDSRVTMLRRPENLGIMRGLHACLEAAHGEYVMPLDADDLLTADALQVIVTAILENNRPPFLYGDEDAWLDGRPANPYFRPAWDPLLNLSSSYIWHPSVFKREAALRLGVFTDRESEFCQDWDTVFRFVQAGATPMHIPEILYHWRAHPASSTNKADRAGGSLCSQRHVLQQFVDRQPDPQLYELAEFPLFRGLPEWWIKRRRTQPPAMAVFVLTDDGDSATSICDLVTGASNPFIDVFAVDAVGRESLRVRCVPFCGLAGLRQAIAACRTPLAVVVSGGVRPEGDEWPWEAAAIMELVPDVAFLGGRILDDHGIVRAGSVIVDSSGLAVCPDRGQPDDDPGYYALSLKPQSADGVTGHFFVARTVALRRALGDLPNTATLPFLGVWLGRWAEHHGLRATYSPILAARCQPGFEAAESADEAERAALADLLPAPRCTDSRWAWRQRCAEFGAERPFLS